MYAVLGARFLHAVHGDPQIAIVLQSNIDQPEQMRVLEELTPTQIGRILHPCHDARTGLGPTLVRRIIRRDRRCRPMVSRRQRATRDSHAENYGENSETKYCLTHACPPFSGLRGSELVLAGLVPGFEPSPLSP